MNDSAVYMIQNVQNHKVYVGSSKQVRQRRNKHFSALRRCCHENYKLQAEYDMFGTESFRWVVLEYIDSDDLSVLESREQFWIDKLQPEYNIRPTAVNSFWEYKTEESKRIAAEKCRKLGQRIQTQEERTKRAESIKKFWATHPPKTIPQEMREHLSKINTGKKNPNWGKKRTPEQIQRQSDGRANIFYTFKSPEGELVTVKNLSRCNLLPYGALRNLYRGLTKQHKGWTFVEIKKAVKQ